MSNNVPFLSIIAQLSDVVEVFNKKKLATTFNVYE